MPIALYLHSNLESGLYWVKHKFCKRGGDGECPMTFLNFIIMPLAVGKGYFKKPSYHPPSLRSSARLAVPGDMASGNWTK